MKRITLFLTVCLGLSVFQTAFADDTETVRAANKRGTINTVTTNSSGNSRIQSFAQKPKSEQTHTENARSVTKNVRDSAVVKSRNVITKQPVVKQRSAAKSTTPKTVTTRNAGVIHENTTKSRTAVARNNVSKKTTATRTAVTPQKKKNVGRAATLDLDKINSIKSKDYSKCKNVYHECMDEFCANKDTTLRRCACSARIHEFDGIKKQLNDAEEKMLGFNQRLLTVGLDKEDALAINVATEGEQAFSTKDTSESEKLLNKITKTLNGSADSKITNNLASVSLELDMDSVWDTVDATGGMSTTAKSGLGLYNAALPVCLEMAKEVCSNDELQIAEDSYKLAIQQDCNTVSKAYSTQYNKAMNKIHESGALLDMARLNAYQQRNSDDILTCKRKILDQLSDASVCGENLYKCLDITGQYIDPSNGSAFLSADLFNLTTLLTPPTGDTKWTKVSANKAFVDFLNSKKMFLKTATEQCKDIADYVWSDFLEDALAQIKLAQNAKLEEIRRSCVTLISQCKTNALNNLEAFDARAVSTFSIMADATATGMCTDIQNSCIALMDKSINDDGSWSKGLSGLMTDITYDKILENCLIVGQTCIMERCAGTAGSFALCDTVNKPMRQSILRTDICWADVEQCVQQFANLDAITIEENIDSLVNNNLHSCTNSDDKACLITNKIWGDCNQSLPTNGATCTAPGCLINQDDTSSLLAWFAGKTSTSCDVPRCATGYLESCGICAKTLCPSSSDCNVEMFPTDDAAYPLTTNDVIYVYDNLENFCSKDCNKKDMYGNCCAGTDIVDPTYHICVPKDYKAILVQTATCDNDDENSNPYYCAGDNGKGKELKLYCITKHPNNLPSYSSDNISCDTTPVGYTGIWILVDSLGNYFPPAHETTSSETTKYTSINYEGTYKQITMYYAHLNRQCYFRFSPDSNVWTHMNWPAQPSTTGGCIAEITGPSNGSLNEHFMIDYYYLEPNTDP